MSTEWKDMKLSRIEAAKVGLSPKQQKNLRLELLERIVIRIDTYSETCESCATVQRDAVDMLASSLTSSNFNKKEYDRLINGLIKHLKDVHKLQDEGENASTYMALGMMFGMVFGMTVFKTLGMTMGLSIGMALGVAVGSGIDKKNKENGKCI